MTWIEYLPAFLVGAGVLLLPGLAVAYAFGARGLTLWAGTGPVSISMIGVAAVIAPVVGMPWSVQAVGGLSLAAGLVGLALRRWSWQPPSGAKDFFPSRPVHWLLPALLILSGGILAFRILSIFGSPENISQTFDNVFHLNAVRFILDSGSASSFTIGNLTDSTGQPGAYPAAWHAFVSLAVQISGLPIPGVVNVCNVLIGVLVWPSGCVLLTRRVVGTSPVAAVVAALSAAGLSQFPYLLLDFGVLYPLMLAVAILPFALSVLISALTPRRGSSQERLSSTFLLGLSVPGMVLAHPSSLLALLAFGTPWVMRALIAWNASLRLASGRPIQRLLPPAFLLTFVLGAVMVWQRLRPDPAAAFWQPIQSMPQAFGEAVTASAMGRPMPVVIAILTVSGLFVAASEKKHWPLLMSFVAAVALYVVVSALWFGRFRSFLTGGWYNDSYRIAALLPVVTIPVAALGAIWFGTFVMLRFGDRGNRLLRTLPARKQVAVAVLASALGCSSFAAVTQYQSVWAEISNAANSYILTDDSKLLSIDESLLLATVGEHVPSEESVIGNPWTGASLVYALSNRRTLEPHMLGKPSEEAKLIERRLSQLGSDPAVCDAVRSLRSYWVLDFGKTEVHGGSHPYPGIRDLDRQSSFRLVEKRGTARLYEVVGCR